MIILTLKTDNPIAEIGIYKDTIRLEYETWEAHRQLAETLHTKIATMLQKLDLQWESLEGLVVFKGPGSFTGLRIGISVINTLSYSLAIPCIGTIGDEWLIEGLNKIINGTNEQTILPLYGSEAHITMQKK